MSEILSRVDRPTFWQIINVTISALAGALIAIPVVGITVDATKLPFFLIFIGAGALIGYRRRNSHAFLYLALVTVVALATLIGISLPN